MKKLYDEFKIDRGVMAGHHFMKRYETNYWYIYQVTFQNQFWFDVFKKKYRNGNESYPIRSEFRKAGNAFQCSKLDTGIAYIENHGN